MIILRLRTSRRPTKHRAKRDARDIISSRKKIPLPKEDARHLLSRIKPLQEDARTKLLEATAQVGYYTESFRTKTNDLPGYKIPKVSDKPATESANKEPSNSEKETSITSVKQNSHGIQKEPNSVKQNNINSKTDNTEIFNKIVRNDTYLGKNPLPVYNPVKRFKSHRTEAEIRAEAEKNRPFKDTRFYNSKSHVLPGLFDNLDNIPPYAHQVINVRTPRRPLPHLRDRHLNADHRTVIIGGILASHLAREFKTGLQAAAFRDKEKFIPPTVIDNRPSILDVSGLLHDLIKTEALWRIIFTDVSTYGVGNNKQKPALIQLCHAVNEQCAARHKHPRSQRCRVIVCALPPHWMSIPLLTLP